MITVGDSQNFAISFVINSIYPRVERGDEWVYGHFVLSINGEQYGDISDEVSLDYCVGWVEWLLTEKFTYKNYQFEVTQKYRDLSPETIKEMVNFTTLYLVEEEDIDKHLDYAKKHRDYAEKCRCLFRDTSITHVGLTSFEEAKQVLLMMDHSLDTKRFIIIQKEEDYSQKVYEHFVPTRIVYKTISDFLKKYIEEKKKFKDNR